MSLTSASFFQTLVAFISLCFLASSISILNDVRDRETDRSHPIKRNRPIASGRVPAASALILAFFLCMAGLAVAWGIGMPVVELAGLYLVLNLAYSLGLKHVPILDIFIVAMGYVIRILVGGVVGDVPISMWIVIMTFLITLFIALAKRRDDVLIFNESGLKTRKAVDGYTLPLIHFGNDDHGSGERHLPAYHVYRLSRRDRQIQYREALRYHPIRAPRILRYLQLAHVENRTGSPTELLYKDRFIQLTLIGWILAFMFIIYWR